MPLAQGANSADNAETAKTAENEALSFEKEAS